LSLYVDASALLKVYVEEHESDKARLILADPRQWASGRHSLVEVRRNLARLLGGADLQKYRRWFETHWAEMAVVELNEGVCERAAEFSEATGARSLDALHLGAAAAVGAEDGLPMVTFDRRLAAAARSLGWTVLGAA
jgi:predicted nucleic acid-binding protein